MSAAKCTVWATVALVCLCLAKQVHADDTIIPSRSDLTLNDFYLGGSILSLIASLFVLVSWFWIGDLRRITSSSIIFTRALFEVFNSIQFIILKSSSSEQNSCEGYSFVFQFSLLGSQIYYFMLSVDLYLTLTNPFRDPKKSQRLFHSVVWLLSLLSAISISVTHSFSFRRDTELCWTRPTGDSGANGLNWGLFFTPIALFLTWGILITISGMLQLFEISWCMCNRRKIGPFDETRINSSLNLFRYVFVFTIYWILMGALYIGIWSVNKGRDSDNPANPKDYIGLFGTFAVFLSIRGFIDAGVWFYNFFSEIQQHYRKWWPSASVNPFRRSIKSELPAGPAAPKVYSLDQSLRKEVLFYFTSAIKTAVERLNDTNANILHANELQIFHYPQPNELFSCGDVHARCWGQALVDPVSNPKGVQKLPVPRLDQAAEIYLPCMKLCNLFPTPDVFYDYAPEPFRFLRFHWGIDDKEYLASMSDPPAEKFSEGASGSLFYFTKDQRYLIKTITEDEATFLISFLPHYVRYMSDNSDSLINKICGFYSIKLYTTHYFIVLQNVFLTESKFIHKRYDLKGSWINRTAKRELKTLEDEQPSQGGHDGPRIKSKREAARGIYKDLDLTEQIRLPADERQRFRTQAKRDAEFLMSQGIMDYSLLLGIHNSRHYSRRSVASHLSAEEKRRLSHRRLPEERESAFDTGIQAAVIEGPGVYFFGIIDILQRYNCDKKMERWAKVFLRCQDKDGISAVPPEQYSVRFSNFMYIISDWKDDDEHGRASMVDDEKKEAAAENAPNIQIKIDQSVVSDSSVSLLNVPPS